MKRLLLSTAAAAIAKCPFLFGPFTMGFDGIAGWYNSNGVYRFPIGTHIELTRQRAFGYGIRPKGVIVGYVHDPQCGDQFVVDMTRGAEDGRTTKREIHFKWNIENHFQRPRTLASESRTMRAIRYLRRLADRPSPADRTDANFAY